MTNTTPPPGHPKWPVSGDRGRVIIENVTVTASEPQEGTVTFTYECEGYHHVHEAVVCTDSDDVLIEIAGPAFRHNEVWQDGQGLRWVAQTPPGDEDADVIRLYSALGSIATDGEPAARYAPWMRVVPSTDDADRVIADLAQAMADDGDDDAPEKVRDVLVELTAHEHTYAGGEICWVCDLRDKLRGLHRYLIDALSLPADTDLAKALRAVVMAAGVTMSGDRDEDEPKAWTDDRGRFWDLTYKYYDREGDLWHWAGGHEAAGPASDLVPLFSRDDWKIVDVPVTAVDKLLGPLTAKER